MPAGRNQKNNADYFSHDADASADEKLVYLESIFGHTGYALYFKFLECMTRADDFKLKWDEIKKAVYAAKFSVSVTEIEQFVTECCRDEIKAFVVDDGHIYSPGLIKRFSALIAKREYNRQKYQEQKQEDTIQLQKKEIQKQKRHSKGEESKGNTYTDDFLEFWQAYPKKVGKGAAWSAWKKTKKQRPPNGRVVEAVNTQKRSEQWRKDDGQYIPNPATWLNQHRWEDEAEAAHQEPIIERVPF